MSASQFSFYEEVLVRSSREELAEVLGERGVILGMAEKEGRWSYAVMIESSGICWSVEAGDLSRTGRIRTREEFYDGASVRVSRGGKLLDKRADQPPEPTPPAHPS